MKKGRLIVLVGKSGSGKSTLAKYMLDCGVPVIKPYTTRIKRGAEDTDYNFVSCSEFFDQWVDYVDTAEYETAYGVWYYGFKIPYLEEDTVIILNPKQIKKFEKFNPIVVYLEVSNEVLLNRLSARMDDLESKRRFNSDIQDFKHIQYTTDIIVDCKDRTVEELANELALKVEEIKSKGQIESR